MEMKKLAPWNWFKHEEASEPGNVPVTRGDQPYYTPLAQFHDEVDRLFDSAFRDFGFPSLWGSRGAPAVSGSALLKPSVDITASDSEYTITLEVPGVDKDDVQLELNDDVLTVRGEKKHESEKKDKDIYRVERSYGSFQRVLSLPEDAEREDIQARFDNGVLTITLPRKAGAKPKGKVIDIQ